MEKEKITLRFYRHKEEKGVYLIRNWHYGGGNADTDFYQATTDLVEAIKSVEKEKIMVNDKFEKWMNHFEEDGGLYVTHVKHIQARIDGYEGTLKKEMKLYVRDFEKVVLQEV